jgi:RNA polymerase sigma factor (TIGR02999 family)
MSRDHLTSQLLELCNSGDGSALEELFPLVIDELRRIAHAHMRKESEGHTLQTTALINEAYLKLIKQKEFKWENRTHFFAVASKVMRHILLDYARTRTRSKRGGGAVHVEFDESFEVSDEKSAELIALDDALNQLAEIDELKARIVEMRHFGGMSVDETAQVLDIAPFTVMRHWNMAIAWLRREIANN